MPRQYGDLLSQREVLQPELVAGAYCSTSEVKNKSHDIENPQNLYWTPHLTGRRTPLITNQAKILPRNKLAITRLRKVSRTSGVTRAIYLAIRHPRPRVWSQTILPIDLPCYTG